MYMYSLFTYMYSFVLSKSIPLSQKVNTCINIMHVHVIMDFCIGFIFDINTCTCTCIVSNVNYTHVHVHTVCIVHVHVYVYFLMYNRNTCNREKWVVTQCTCVLHISK